MDYDVKRIADNARIYHGAQSMFAQFGSALYDVVFVCVGDGVVLQGVEGSLFPVSVLFSECLFYKPLSLIVIVTSIDCKKRFHSLQHSPPLNTKLQHIHTKTTTNTLTNDEHQHCTAHTVVHR